MNLTWTTSVSAGALHAARALSTGRTLVDPALDAALRSPATALAAAVAASGCSDDVVWRELFSLATGRSVDREVSNRQTAEAASPPSLDRLSDALERLEAAFALAQPRAADELRLRQEPLRVQWEARGPGLLFGVRRLTSADWLVPSATVILLTPVLGGAGQAHPPYNAVTFEAMLANPIAQLPEVLRLGWLLAQLNPALAFDALASNAPVAASGAWRRAAPWALLAMVLAAAEDVELAAADRAHFELAAAQWMNDPSAAEPVWRWWQSYAQRRPGWPAGLAALDQELSLPRT